MPVPVLDPYGPTLPLLLARRGLGKRIRIAVIATLLVVGAILVVAYERQGARSEREVINRTGVQFNFRYPPKTLPRVTPKGDELIRLEREDAKGRFNQSFTVRPMRLPAYKGQVAAVLPVYADRVTDQLQKTYSQFELLAEGRSRVNQSVAYQLLFRARLGPRRLFGRVVFLPEQDPGDRDGVILTVEATPAAGVGLASDVGTRGVTKRPFRTFRLGTTHP